MAECQGRGKKNHGRRELNNELEMQSIHPLKADVHIAAAKNDSETVQNLINNDRTLLHLVLPDTGESLVHIAALYDAHDVLELLYGEGADFTSKTSDGKTVVHCAASSGSAVTLRCLLSKEGMSQLVNSPNKEGDTPAHNAMVVGCADCVSVLVEHSADFNLRNSYSKTPTDLARLYGNTQCLTAVGVAAVGVASNTVGGIPGEPTRNQRSSKVTSPSSSDEKGTGSDGVEHGQNTRRVQEREDMTVAQGRDQKNSHSINGHISHRGTDREGQLPEAQPIKPKSLTKNLGKSKEKERPLNNVGKRAKPLSTLPSPDRIETPKAKRSTLCSACGREKVLREFFIDCPSGITVGHTGIEKGNRAMLTELICYNCQPSPSPYSIPSRRASVSGRKSPERRDGQRQGRKSESGLDKKSVDPSESSEGSSIADNDKEESGYYTLDSRPQGTTKLPERAERPSASGRAELATSDTPEPPPTVDIEYQKAVAVSDLEVKLGESVPLRARASTKSLCWYNWYQVSRGKPDRHLKTAAQVKLEVKKTMKVFCRVSSEDGDDSRTLSINPKPVWITSQLRPSGSMCYGKRVELKCRAEKHHSVKGDIRYLWLKKKLPGDNFSLYPQATTEKLTFERLSPENDGIYICQAEVKGDFTETEEFTVQGSIEPGFSIVKQPWSRVVSEGSSFKLTCRAELKEVCESALSYQWFHNDTAIRGASACIFKKTKASAEHTGHYRCRVTDEKGTILFTQPATVSLVHQGERDGGGDITDRSLKQLDQWKAEKILQTLDGKHYACGKVALVIGNTAYRHLPSLTSSITDVRILTEGLADAGFKVFSLVNLTCAETNSALKFITGMLVPGAYVVFAYSGHGCNCGNTDYIIPIDAPRETDINMYIASSTVCEQLQSKLCRVFLLMNCCRDTAKSANQVPPGHDRRNNYGNSVIFTASTEGHPAYEEKGKASSFTTAFVEALREGGGYRDVFDRVQLKLKSSSVSVGGRAFANPTLTNPGMDLGITFQDTIMLDSEELEKALDHIEDNWRSANIPPHDVTLTPEALGSGLSAVIGNVELWFDCDCSNVLVMTIKWSHHHPATTTCTVDIEKEGQGVGIERLSVQKCEACFEVSSLQRLHGDLNLHLVFTVSSDDDPTQQHKLYSVIHDLKSRPLYAPISHPNS